MGRGRVSMCSCVLLYCLGFSMGRVRPSYAQHYETRSLLKFSDKEVSRMTLHDVIGPATGEVGQQTGIQSSRADGKLGSKRSSTPRPRQLEGKLSARRSLVKMVWGVALPLFFLLVISARTTRLAPAEHLVTPEVQASRRYVLLVAAAAATLFGFAISMALQLRGRPKTSTQVMEQVRWSWMPGIAFLGSVVGTVVIGSVIRAYHAQRAAMALLEKEAKLLQRKKRALLNLASKGDLSGAGDLRVVNEDLIRLLNKLASHVQDSRVAEFLENLRQDGERERNVFKAAQHDTGYDELQDKLLELVAGRESPAPDKDLA